MLDHHIQRSIVYALAFTDSMRFGELKPDDLDNKLFTYHLKKVIAAGLVKKNSDGEYTLTSEGRRVGKGALQTKVKQIDKAYSILLLAIQRKNDGAWLLYKRHTHPLIGLSGFMQALPAAEENIVNTAKLTCKIETGLVGEFQVQGHGFFKVFRSDELESYIHFTLLKCTDIEGQLLQNSEFGEYYWQQTLNFDSEDMLPNTQTLYKMLEAPAGSFVEKTFRI